MSGNVNLFVICSGHLSPSYRNVGRDEGRYLGGRENSLLNRLHHGGHLSDLHQGGHLGDLSSEQLNQTSIGTHV